MIVFFVILAVITAIAVWLSERVDRPRRRAARDAARELQPAE
jgi:hypothetical protein